MTKNLDLWVNEWMSMVYYGPTMLQNKFKVKLCMSLELIPSKHHKVELIWKIYAINHELNLLIFCFWIDFHNWWSKNQTWLESFWIDNQLFLSELNWTLPISPNCRRLPRLGASLHKLICKTNTGMHLLSIPNWEIEIKFKINLFKGH